MRGPAVVYRASPIRAQAAGETQQQIFSCTLLCSVMRSLDQRRPCDITDLGADHLLDLHAPGFRGRLLQVPCFLKLCLLEGYLESSEGLRGLAG